jgi:hypothetical protein
MCVRCQLPDLRIGLRAARHAPVVSHPLQGGRVVIEDLRHARGGQQPVRVQNAQLLGLDRGDGHVDSVNAAMPDGVRRASKVNTRRR